METAATTVGMVNECVQKRGWRPRLRAVDELAAADDRAGVRFRRLGGRLGCRAARICSGRG